MNVAWALIPKKWLIYLGLIGILLLALIMIGAISSFVSIWQNDDTDHPSYVNPGDYTGLIPRKYIPIYSSAAQKYDVDWYYLAGIHRVETNFGTNLSVSTAGAIGQTQFMPCTFVGWGFPGCGGLGNADIPKDILEDPAMIKKYGGYGVDANGDGMADPYNVKDAIYSTANYLHQNGFISGNPSAIRNAIFAYNHSTQYVEKVTSFALKYKNMGKTASSGSGKWKPPVTPVTVTSPFGWRTWDDGSREFHKGIDFACTLGVTPIHAAKAGKVIYAQFNNGGYGNYVMIDNGKLISAYAHMSALTVHVGERVEQGQQVGICGSTGNSTGPHSHFEIKTNLWSGELNPAKYLGIPNKVG